MLDLWASRIFVRVSLILSWALLLLWARHERDGIWTDNHIDHSSYVCLYATRVGPLLLRKTVPLVRLSESPSNENFGQEESIQYYCELVGKGLSGLWTRSVIGDTVGKIGNSLRVYVNRETAWCSGARAEDEDHSLHCFRWWRKGGQQGRAPKWGW